MVYNKLVRDKIPDLIRQQGQKPLIRALSDEEYARCLAEKLNEEVAEFQRDRNIEELADILEVVYALAENLGASREDLMAVYQKKNAERGGFVDRVFLISKEDNCL
jgi:predicted house-cleaning noncanonical NTP pyrophosphatase (MazG superfamily)